MTLAPVGVVLFRLNGNVRYVKWHKVTVGTFAGRRRIGWFRAASVARWWAPPLRP